MPETHITNSALQTEKLGFEFAKGLKPGDVICLYGELGAGKTTFTQGVAHGLGITSRVISPTFSLVRQYEVKKKPDTTGNKIKTLYHIDLYRLSEINEIKMIGIQEILESSEGIVLVEWPEKIESLLPAHYLIVTITDTGENREVEIKSI